MLTENPASARPPRTRSYAQMPQFQRVKVSVLGRYMLADRREFPCQVLEMSPGDAVVVAPVAGTAGEKVIAYLDQIGRVEGTIQESTEGGFVMDVAASSRKRDKMAAQLTWLANKDILNLPEDRRHGRFIPRNTQARLILQNGTNVGCRIIDLSASGAAVAIAPDLLPPVGAAVTIGKTAGRVVRHIENGFAIEFQRLQHPDFIEDNVTGE